MTLEIVYNKNKFQTNILIDGTIIINSNPFYLEYNITPPSQTYVDISDFSKNTKTSNICVKTKNKSKLPLSSIDKVLYDEKEFSFKVEIVKGQVYLMNKPLEDYLKS
jgi:hypothetical protein